MTATKAITVRLENGDYKRLETRADRLGVRPGTLARMLLRSGLAQEADALDPRRQSGIDALDWLSALRQRLPQGDVDAVAVVRQGREELERRRS